MQLLHTIHSNVESWSNMVLEILKFHNKLPQEQMMSLYCINPSLKTTDTHQTLTVLREEFDKVPVNIPELITKRSEIINSLFRIIDSV